MKKEIKFLAYNKILNCTSEVLEIDFEHDAIRCIPGHLPKNKLSDVVLMQYTGLKDKNGREIYEDFILETDWKNGKRLRLLVTSKSENPGFYLDDKIRHGEFVLSKYNSDYYEVVGNLHENPELLK